MIIFFPAEDQPLVPKDEAMVRKHHFTEGLAEGELGDYIPTTKCGDELSSNIQWTLKCPLCERQWHIMM